MGSQGKTWPYLARIHAAQTVGDVYLALTSADFATLFESRDVLPGVVPGHLQIRDCPPRECQADGRKLKSKTTPPAFYRAGVVYRPVAWDERRIVAISAVDVWEGNR
jgi:hypothetical protein